MEMSSAAGDSLYFRGTVHLVYIYIVVVVSLFNGLDDYWHGPIEDVH